MSFLRSLERRTLLGLRHEQDCDGDDIERALLVAGARPNFMKVAPLIAALKTSRRRPLFVHTGQHYDVPMSDVFLHGLGFPAADYMLRVGSGSHAQQTARIMEAFEPVLIETRPEWIVVVGDVNSTLACTLVAAKLKDEIGCQIAHVEAGLRSGDWSMPEEVNRVLTDRLSDLLLIPSLDARDNLLREGIDDHRIFFAGNVMIDTLFMQLQRARDIDVPGTMGLEHGKYALATLHRPPTVDHPETLRVVLEALDRIAANLPVILPLHPRTQKNVASFGLESYLENLEVLEPLGYCDMLSLTDGACVVLTDSGGLQEETTVLGVPCLTVRERTERPITLVQGTNRLVPWPVTIAGVLESFREAMDEGRRDPPIRCPPGWDGRAAERIVEAMSTFEVGRRKGITTTDWRTGGTIAPAATEASPMPSL